MTFTNPLGSADVGEDAAATMQDEITGQSVFWVMITLAMGAMAQPSVSNRTSRKAFSGSLDPVRSLPAACLVDGIFDIVTLSRAVRARRRRRSYPALSAARTRAGPTQHLGRTTRLASSTVAIKLTAFVLGVLPQALKLFNMRGVPFSQACGAAFLFAMVTGMVVELVLDNNELFEFYLLYSKNENTRSRCRAVWLLCIMSHILMETRIWGAMKNLAPIRFPYSFCLIGMLISVVCFVFSGLGIILLAYGSVRWLRYRYPMSALRVPITAFYLPTVLLNCIDPVNTSSDANTRSAEISYMVWAVIASMLVSEILVYAGAWIARRYNKYVDDEAIALGTHPLIIMGTGIGNSGQTSDPGPSSSLPASASISTADRPATPTEIEKRGEMLMHYVESKILATILFPLLDKENAYDGDYSAFSDRSNHLILDGTSQSSQLAIPTTNARASTFRDHVRLLQGKGLALESWLFSQLIPKASPSTRISFGVFNLITTVVYYLVSFDGTGTSSPSWTSILG